VLTYIVVSQKAKRYAVVLNAADKDKGYQCVSLVANPAIQRGWVALSAVAEPKAKRVHLSAEPQRQVLTGPVLVPNEDIYRNDPEPHYIFFQADTIQQIARKLMKEGRTTDTNADHSIALEGNVIEELWIVADPEKDKAAALGLEVPAGTLMMSLHVPDADYWQKEIVEGNKTGFSIEGLFDFAEVKLSAQEPAKPTMKNKFLFTLLSAVAKQAGYNLTQVALSDGRIVDTADNKATLLSEDGEPGEVLADGEHELVDGSKLTIKDGKVAAPEASTEGTQPAEGQKQEAPKEEPNTQLAANVKLEAVKMADGSEFNLNPITRLLTDSTGQVVGTGSYACADGSYFKVNLDQYTYQIDKDTYERSTKLSAVETELEATKKELEEKKGKVVELSAQLSAEPAAKPIKLSSDAGKTETEKLTELPLALRRVAELQAQQTPK